MNLDKYANAVTKRHVEPMEEETNGKAVSERSPVLSGRAPVAKRLHNGRAKDGREGGPQSHSNLNPTASAKPLNLPGIKIVNMSEVTEEAVRFLWKPYIARGALTMLDGDPGVGKSWLVLAIAARVSKGGTFPGGYTQSAPEKVLLLATEDDLAKVIKARLRVVGANDHNIIAIEETIDAETLTMNAEGVAWLDVLLTTTKPALVVIDTLVNFTSGKIDVNRANTVREMMKPLAMLAKKHDCAILCTRHLKKQKGGPAIYQGQGSMDFVGVARSVLVAAKEDEDVMNGPVIMAHSKNNWGKLGPSLKYHVRRHAFLWQGEVSITANQLLADDKKSKKGQGQVDKAKALIVEALRKGPLLANDLWAYVEDAGIAKKTYTKARDALKEEMGLYPSKTKKGWVWTHPKVTTVPKKSGKVARRANILTTLLRSKEVIILS